MPLQFKTVKYPANARGISKPKSVTSFCTDTPVTKIDLGKQKTRLCKSFDAGRDCSYGARCAFAHGIDELRTIDKPTTAAPTMKQPLSPAPSTPSAAAGGFAISTKHSDRQTLEHEYDAIPSEDDLQQQQPIVQQAQPQNQQQNPQPPNASGGGDGAPRGQANQQCRPKNYRTVLCEHYNKKNGCWYGAECLFIHAPQQQPQQQGPRPQRGKRQVDYESLVDEKRKELDNCRAKNINLSETTKLRAFGPGVYATKLDSKFRMRWRVGQDGYVEVIDWVPSDVQNSRRLGRS